MSGVSAAGTGTSSGSAPLTKTCLGCRRDLALEEFTPDKLGKHGRTARCRPCRRDERAAARRADPERHRGYTRAYAIRNRAGERERSRAYYRANRDQKIARKAAQRARAAGAAGHATGEQIRARIDFYGGRCWICGCDDATTIDHVIPFQLGGTNWPANIRPACNPCNASKQNRHPRELLQVAA